MAAGVFTCSVISRYEVSRWTALLDLRHGRDVSLFECALDPALTAVPGTLTTALGDLATLA